MWIKKNTFSNFQQDSKISKFPNSLTKTHKDEIRLLKIGTRKMRNENEILMNHIQNIQQFIIGLQKSLGVI